VLARVLSCAVVGLEGELVDVEVDINRGEQASGYKFRTPLRVLTGA
jgi:hypothetical protein